MLNKFCIAAALLLAPLSARAQTNIQSWQIKDSTIEMVDLSTGVKAHIYSASTTTLAAIAAEAAARVAADALKVDKNAPDQVNLSTVTAALALKMDLAGGVFSGPVSGTTLDLSGHISASSGTFVRDGSNLLRVVALTGSGQTAGLMFQRGNLMTDAYNDWEISDESGDLYFRTYQSGSSHDEMRLNGGSGSMALIRTGLVVGSTVLTPCSTCTLQVNGGASVMGDIDGRKLTLSGTVNEVTTPPLSTVADSNTGLYFPANNSVGIACGGDDCITFSDDNGVSISSNGTHAGGLTVAGNILNSGSATSLTYSSAPVVHVSSLQAPGVMEMYVANGLRIMRLSTTGQARLGPAGLTATSTRGSVDIVDLPAVNSSPRLVLANWNNSITEGSVIGTLTYDTEDTSTAGQMFSVNLRAKAMAPVGATDWTSASSPSRPVEWAVSMSTDGAHNDTPVDVFVVRSTEVVVPFRLRLGQGATVTLDSPVTASGWVGTSGGTITYSGAIMRSNIVDTPIISTQIPCAVGISSIVLNISTDRLAIGERWELKLDMFQVSAATGIPSIRYNNISSLIYDRKANNLGGNGPFTTDDGSEISFLSDVNTRFNLEVNKWQSVSMEIWQNPIEKDKIAGMWTGSIEQSSLGTGLVEQFSGAGEMNGPSSTEIILQQITIGELPSTVGQGLWCGSINLRRKAL